MLGLTDLSNLIGWYLCAVTGVYRGSSGGVTASPHIMSLLKEETRCVCLAVLAYSILFFLFLTSTLPHTDGRSKQ